MLDGPTLLESHYFSNQNEGSDTNNKPIFVRLAEKGQYLYR